MMTNHLSGPYSNLQGIKRAENFVEQRCCRECWAEEGRKKMCAKKGLDEAHFCLHNKSRCFINLANNLGENSIGS